MQVAYFVNSGSEANDMAMLMARLYTGNYDMLALRNCYHGMSEGTMGVTAHNTWKFSVPQVRKPSPHISWCQVDDQSGLSDATKCITSPCARPLSPSLW